MEKKILYFDLDGVFEVVNRLITQAVGSSKNDE